MIRLMRATSRWSLIWVVNGTGYTIITADVSLHAESGLWVTHRNKARICGRARFRRTSAKTRCGVASIVGASICVIALFVVLTAITPLGSMALAICTDIIFRADNTIITSIGVVHIYAACSWVARVVGARIAIVACHRLIRAAARCASICCASVAIVTLRIALTTARAGA